MINMEVEIISDEIIKPSSQTPNHLNHYQLSFLDQLSPSIYNPFIYYYSLKNDTNISEICRYLKKSLSLALTVYYPLAGRLGNDRLTLKCNDDGVQFFEARVTNAELGDVLKNPVPSELNKLLPFELDEVAGEYLIGVKVNAFSGGGIAVGVCVSHRIADALSCLAFVRAWTALARGEPSRAAVARPEFVSAGLFPPKDVAGYDNTSSVSKLDTIVTKRFVFDGPKIEALKARFAKGDEEKITKPPSRVSALTAFIWHRFVASAKENDVDDNKLYTAHHAVNLRPKLDPPLPEHSFGNYYRASKTIEPSIAGEALNPSLARKITEDIKKIDETFVADIRANSDEFLESIWKGSERFRRGDFVPLVFSSLCRFPLYEADFGFGKPKWVSSAARCFKNIVGFMDDETGDGIEAYVCLKPQDMVKLEADQEFLAYVSPSTIVP